MYLIKMGRYFSLNEFNFKRKIRKKTKSLKKQRRKRKKKIKRYPSENEI